MDLEVWLIIFLFFVEGKDLSDECFRFRLVIILEFLNDFFYGQCQQPMPLAIWWVSLQLYDLFIFWLFCFHGSKEQCSWPRNYFKLIVLCSIFWGVFEQIYWQNIEKHECHEEHYNLIWTPWPWYDKQISAPIHITSPLNYYIIIIIHLFIPRILLLPLL